MGKDGFGTWLFTPKGSRYRGEKPGVVGYCNVGSPIGPGVAAIHLIPLTGWWIATFWDESESSWSLTVDICTPPRLADGVWTYTDLELDVLVDAGTGDIQVDDEDEFVDACERGSITLDEAVAARQATDKIVQLVRELREPFASAGNHRLRDALMLGLAPIRDLP
jgi:hypothetical protein